MDANVSVDLGKNTTELLEKLAQSLGMTVEKIFPYYVKQQVVEAYTYISISLAFFLIGVILFTMGYCWGQKHKWDEEHILDYIFAVGGGIVLVGGTIATAVNTHIGIPKILNPEYHAIHQIIADIALLKP